MKQNRRGAIQFLHRGSDVQCIETGFPSLHLLFNESLALPRYTDF